MIFTKKNSILYLQQQKIKHRYKRQFLHRRFQIEQNKDCCFTKGNKWFRYRAAAIIIENDCVLMAGNEKDDYYYSVGGAVHAGETAEEAVKREVLEETGISYEIDRLVFIHENFFPGSSSSIQDLTCHEIAFYFLMKSRGTQEVNSDSYCSGGREFMHWIPLTEYKNHKAYPSFFADKLINMPYTIEHIVTKE